MRPCIYLKLTPMKYATLKRPNPKIWSPHKIQKILIMKIKKDIDKTIITFKNAICVINLKRDIWK